MYQVTLQKRFKICHIFIIRKPPCSFFRFSFHATLFFALMQWAFTRGKVKLHEMKNEKNYIHGFSYDENMANFEAFL